MNHRIRLPYVLSLLIVLPAGCAYQERLERGDVLLERGDYEQAIQMFRSARDYPLAWSSAAAETKIEESKSRWAAVLDAQARELEQAGHPGAAWVVALKAADLNPQAADLQRPNRLRLELLRRGAYPVAAEAADPLAQVALAAAAGRMPGGTTLRLEFDRGAPTKAGLRLAMEDPKFDEQARQTTRSTRYQVGERTVPNAHFPARMAEMDAARHALAAAERREHDHFQDFQRRDAERDRLAARLESRGRDRDEVRRRDDAMARLHRLNQQRDHAKNTWEQARQYRRNRESDLERTIRELEATPEWLVEAILADHVYPATIRTLTATAALHGAVQHGDGRPGIAIEEQVRSEASALSHAAQPVAGIGPFSEPLPDREAMVGRLVDMTAGEAREALIESFGGFRARILEAADMAASDAEALDHLTAYWLTDPGHVDGEVRRRIDQLAQALAEIPDASRLMAKR
jgi:hypothetical protein